MRRNLQQTTPLGVARFVACPVVCICLACSQASADNRSFDGTGNNAAHPLWGAAGTDLVRLAAPAYDDGYSTPRGGLIGPTFPNPALPNVRVVSNDLVKQPVMLPNAHEMTDWVFQWGQFVDHDLDMTDVAVPSEPFNISIPLGDPQFDKNMLGNQVMDFQRSKYDPTTGTGPGNPRQQINDITSYLDASVVYGSDETCANTLREHAGGRLLTRPRQFVAAQHLWPAQWHWRPSGPHSVLRRR